MWYSPDWLPGFWTNIAADIAIFVVGFLLGRAIDLWQHFQFRRFWGKRAGANEAPFLIAAGVYRDTRSRGAPRYVKVLSSGQILSIIGGDEAGSQAEVRAASYLASEVGRYRRSAVTIDTDERLAQRWDGTVIALGSGGSNEKSAVILALPQNKFCEFDHVLGGIRSLWDGQLHQVKIAGTQPVIDIGMIVKLTNPWFTGHSLIVCAGMNEQGTSGAAYYLAHHWRDLLSRYGSQPFGIVLEVQWASDHTATPVALSRVRTPFDS